MAADTTPALNLNMTTTGTQVAKEQLAQQMQAGFQAGVKAGYQYINTIAVILLASYVLEFVVGKFVALNVEGDDVVATVHQYTSRFWPRIQSNLWTMRAGLLTVMVFNLYIFTAPGL